MSPKVLPAATGVHRLPLATHLAQRKIHSTSRPHPFVEANKKHENPESSHDHFPMEHVHLDQNSHLKHAVSSQGGDIGRDSGKGAAALIPELPSHAFEVDDLEKNNHELKLGGSENIYPVEKKNRDRAIAEEK